MENKTIWHGPDACEIHNLILPVHQIQVMNSRDKLMSLKSKRIVIRELLEHSKTIFCREWAISHKIIFKPAERLSVARIFNATSLNTLGHTRPIIKCQDFPKQEVLANVHVMSVIELRLIPVYCIQTTGARAKRNKWSRSLKKRRPQKEPPQEVPYEERATQT
mgnify:FL=1